MPFTLLLGLVLVCVPGTVLAWDEHGHRSTWKNRIGPRSSKRCALLIRKTIWESAFLFPTIPGT